MKNIKQVTESSFESIRAHGQLKAEQPYAIIRPFWDGFEFAFSPDGEGVYFYDTYAELEANHG